MQKKKKKNVKKSTDPTNNTIPEKPRSSQIQTGEQAIRYNMKDIPTLQPQAEKFNLSKMSRKSKNIAFNLKKMAQGYRKWIPAEEFKNIQDVPYFKIKELTFSLGFQHGYGGREWVPLPDLNTFKERLMDAGYDWNSELEDNYNDGYNNGEDWFLEMKSDYNQSI